MIEQHRPLRFQVNYLVDEKFVKRRANAFKHVASYLLHDLEMVIVFANLLDGIVFDIQHLSICLNLKEEYLPCNLLSIVPQYHLLIRYHLFIFVVVLECPKVILDLHVNLIHREDFLLLDTGIFLFIKDVFGYVVCCDILNIHVANLTCFRVLG